MISIDTNILMYAFNESVPEHELAYRWMASLQSREDVAISELILAEFYGLLRNPKVLPKPLTSREAVAVIELYRRHPRWRLIGFPNESRALHDSLWKRAKSPDFAFRRLYDCRTALTLVVQGVTDLATVNLKDFVGLGFKRVWNPLDKP